MKAIKKMSWHGKLHMRDGVPWGISSTQIHGLVSFRFHSDMVEAGKVMKLEIIVNPDFKEDEKPGQFFVIKIETKDNPNKLTIERAIAKRMRYTVVNKISSGGEDEY